MKKSYLIIVSIFFSTNIFSQDYLKIVGVSNFVEEPLHYSIKINLEKILIEEQNSIIKKLDELNINYAIDSLNQLSAKLEHKNWNQIDQIEKSLANNNANRKLKYSYKSPDFKDEDNRAISAIVNAREKANLIAEILDRKIIRILNIDDVTESYLSLYDDGQYSECIKTMADYAIELLYTKPNFGETEFDQNFKLRSYLIWVTFEIE